ncbi:MAG: magnesium transporter [Hadesarchaea archaeon DG-33-1]|nr:MAG: magnesium transporter [Hadesarchaea archaeon DG-33-1]
MPRLIKKRLKKVGLPPGALVHIGEKKTEKVRITIVDYDKKKFQEKEAKKVEECFPFKDKPTVTWINVDGIHDPEIIKKLGDYFGMHPLVLEDILNTDQRPKMEDFDNYIYIVLKMLTYDDKSNEVVAEQVSLILGSNFVISFQEKEGDVFNPIRDRIRGDKGRVRKMGADYLAYALTDAIVDNYFTILEKIGERVEFIEEELVTNPTPGTLQTIHNLKRELIFLRKSVWPLREVINGLERGESPLIKGATKVYLRDVYDHTIQVIDTVETLRDMVSGMLDIYLSSISNKMNEVMKVLTIIATIFIPLTFVAGIYGMNFLNMPELEWYFGYPLVLLVMVAIGVTMLFYFRRKKWL